jgi:hypothetical protein
MNDKQINMSERIMKNTQRLLGLINDLPTRHRWKQATPSICAQQTCRIIENMHGVMDQIVHERIWCSGEIDDHL